MDRNSCNSFNLLFHAFFDLVKGWMRLRVPTMCLQVGGNGIEFGCYGVTLCSHGIELGCCSVTLCSNGIELGCCSVTLGSHGIELGCCSITLCSHGIELGCCSVTLCSHGIELGCCSITLGSYGIEFGCCSIALCSYGIEFGCCSIALCSYGIEFGCYSVTLGSHDFELGCCSITLGSYGIELSDHAIDPTVKPLFHPVNLFRKHLVAFHNQVKFVLNGISEGANVAGDHALDLFKVIFVHLYLHYRGPLSSLDFGGQGFFWGGVRGHEISFFKKILRFLSFR